MISLIAPFRLIAMKANYETKTNTNEGITTL